ncbi:hypothetical protein C4D60_Mb04t36430 [Musa balbisiana]|uniref:Dolichyl-diphosphooligosaccharide--protein glycosyltransferase subunit 2 n=1 Tax=Musa balbisiana TaxID=52838 RepID=A0A4S8KHA7_MUSBA|nr:hypothetical protein C4D60_Mb04t36430 [Musa balbisiana]
MLLTTTGPSTFGSRLTINYHLEETYEAFRTFQILGIGKTSDISNATCPIVLDKLRSPTSSPKEFFNALRLNGILGCQIGSQTFENVASHLQALIKDADSLMDLYYSVISLLHIKGQGVSAVLSDAEGVFHSIKALSQSDGRWRYDSNNAESSTYAAGIGLFIGIVKHDIEKLFDSIKNYGS